HLASVYPLPLLLPPPATTETSPLSLHDALPISRDGPVLPQTGEDARLHRARVLHSCGGIRLNRASVIRALPVSAAHLLPGAKGRSEEHTSELQSPYDLVCRLLLEKKKPQSAGQT